MEEESTRTVMAGLWEVIDNKGLFCALYSEWVWRRSASAYAGMKTGAIRSILEVPSKGDIGRLWSGAYSPFVNVVGTRFGNMRLRLLPQGRKPVKERPIFL